MFKLAFHLREKTLNIFQSTITLKMSDVYNKLYLYVNT